MKRKYRELGVKKQITVIGNGVFFPEIQPTFSDKRAAKRNLTSGYRDSNENSLNSINLQKLSATRIWLLNMARLSPEKGQSVLLQTWSKLPESMKGKFQLILVGGESFPGYFRELVALADLNDLKNGHIVFAGPSTQPEQWYLPSEFFISASSIEGHPLGPMEAMAFGAKPILSGIEGHSCFRVQALYFAIHNHASTIFEIETILTKLASAPPSLSAEEWADAKSKWSTFKMFSNYRELYK